MICRVCGGEKVSPLLRTGAQPLCNRFLNGTSDPEAVFTLDLGQCTACGIPQLLEPAPAEELRPRVDWIGYREAEGHLDELVNQLVRLRGGASTVVGAISSKDDSTVDRFRQQGFTGWRLTADELGISGLGWGPESIQAALTPDRAREIAARGRRADIVLARHVLEHAHQPASFVTALLEFVQPGGFIVFEVPDCGPGLQRKDFTMLWEDHVLYFTPGLLQQALRAWGLAEQWFHTYPYSHENSIVAVVSTPGDATNSLDAKIASDAGKLGAEYAASFPDQKEQTQRRLSELLAEGPVAVFGAGHLSCTWINLMDARAHVDCVIDDDPNKRGLFMPGSRLPILPSSALADRQIKSCLLSLNQESEVRVVAARQGFVNQGGRFLTIFPGRANSLVTEVLI